MKNKGIVIVIVLALALGGGVVYRLTHSVTSGGGHEGHTEEQAGGHEGHNEHAEGKEGQEGHAGHDGHGEEKRLAMTPQVQQENGVMVAAAKKLRLSGAIGATGKVEANADRIAHVSPRIPGKVVAVKASLGDAVAAGQVLVTLDSIELGEAIGRYRQAQTRLSLARANMERVKALVEKKIAARKEILQAETEYESARSELHTDEERLALYGLAADTLKGDKQGKPLLPVRSPMGGIVTEKHAIVGELADPATNLFTVADLSSVWVLVDIHEKDLAKVRRGQTAVVTVTAFPELTFRGRITHLADVVDEASRTVKARVEVANPARRLKPEMFATVELAIASDAPPTLAVPEEAVVELAGKKLVFVAEGESAFVPRPVQLGRVSGGLVEVLAGLQEGERYAAKGAFVLKSELLKGDIEGHEH